MLLAAGESRRFGANKLLHELNGDESLVVTCASKLALHVDQLLVVCNSSHATVHQLLADQGIPFAICANAVEGMGVSLAFGISQIPNADAWLIALGDMPSIAPADYANCVAALRNNHSIAAPLWQEKRGHPVGFGKEWQHELLALQGDQGAKKLFEQNASCALYFQAADSGVLRDIDSPEDIQR